MKLPILFIIWFPSTVFLLFFSLYSLTSKQYILYKQSDVLSAYDENADLRKYYNPQNIPDTDFRILVLKNFFSNYNSPLKDFSEDIVKFSDMYGLDYALIPAISMQESNGCRRIPPNSHNCWGFGIYGDRSISFSSFSEAIENVARTLKESYIKRGLTNATLVEDRWTPQSVGQWSYSVNFFIGKIKEFETKLQ